MKSSFNENNFNEYLSDLMSGRVGLEDFKSKVTFKKVDPWNGQDAPPLDL